ncbi:MAG: HAD family hydrolase [Candidatus Hodarchaeota archaeon]
MFIRGVFFDLYGTLLIPKNNKKAWNNWLLTFYKLMRDNGLKLSRNEFADMCSGFFTREEPREKEENLTIYENRIKSFAMDFGLNLESNEIKKIANECVISWHKYVKLDPEAIPILKILRNEKNLALITNFDHPPFIYSILSKYRLIKYFEFIAISGEIGHKKPNPQIFNFTLEKLELEPQDVIYIGDSKEDTEGAINAGIKPILIQRQRLKKRIIGNDYFSKRKTKEKLITNHSSNIIPFKIISRLRELYQILNIKSSS